MSDSATPRRKRTDSTDTEVRALLQRLIDEVAGLRQEVTASRGLLFGNEQAAGLLHEFKSFREEQSKENAELRKLIDARVKIETVESTAKGARWVWAIISTVAGFVGWGIAQLGKH